MPQMAYSGLKKHQLWTSPADWTKIITMFLRPVVLSKCLKVVMCLFIDLEYIYASSNVSNIFTVVIRVETMDNIEISFKVNVNC